MEYAFASVPSCHRDDGQISYIRLVGPDRASTDALFSCSASGMARGVTSVTPMNWQAKATQEVTGRVRVPMEALMTGTPS
jgi:hypothetical protein